MKISFSGRECGFTVVEVLVVVVLLALVGGGVYLWQQSRVDEAKKSATTASVTPTVTVTKTPTVTPTPDPYTGWKTYTHPSNYYSFKYPATWAVSRQVIQDDLDYVYVKANDVTVAQFSRYADGTGCGDVPEQTKTLEMIGQVLTVTSLCNSPFYEKTFASKVVSKTETKSSQNFVAVGFKLDGSHDTELAALAKSITGLILTQ